jgi:hypothetical protein
MATLRRKPHQEARPSPAGPDEVAAQTEAELWTSSARVVRELVRDGLVPGNYQDQRLLSPENWIVAIEVTVLYFHLADVIAASVLGINQSRQFADTCRERLIDKWAETLMGGGRTAEDEVAFRLSMYDLLNRRRQAYAGFGLPDEGEGLEGTLWGEAAKVILEENHNQVANVPEVAARLEAESVVLRPLSARLRQQSA